MAVDVVVEVKKEAVEHWLRQLPTTIAKKAMDATMKDMAKRGPTIIARIARERYELGQNKLNPNTKAGSGSVGVTGGSLSSMAWVYRGPKLGLGGNGFKVTPKGARTKRYTLKTKILRGQWGKVGHWGPPWSEGGRYRRGGDDPIMFLPGVDVPLRRHGSSWRRVVGLSVPQMVLSVQTEDRLREELTRLAAERLFHNITRFLG